MVSCISNENQQKEGQHMETMISAVMMVLIALVGGLPTIAITACIPAVLAWKIYRKVKYGYSLYH